MLVLFDLDDTLIQGDSTMLWLDFCLKRKIITQEYRKKAQCFQQDYFQQKLNMEEFMGFFLHTIKGKASRDVNLLLEDFYTSHIQPIIYPKALELLKQHANHRCILISATSSFIVNKIAQYLKIPETIAVDCEILHGYYTGKILGMPSYQKGKLLRLKEYLGKNYATLIKNSMFYTDSINDIYLLEEVRYPVVCNGDQQLLSLAQEKQWKVLDFKP